MRRHPFCSDMKESWTVIAERIKPSLLLAIILFTKQITFLLILDRFCLSYLPVRYRQDMPWRSQNTYQHSFFFTFFHLRQTCRANRSLLSQVLTKFNVTVRQSTDNISLRTREAHLSKAHCLIYDQGLAVN